MRGEKRRDRIGHQSVNSARRRRPFNAADFPRRCKRQAHPTPRAAEHACERAGRTVAQQSGAAPKVEASAPHASCGTPRRWVAAARGTKLAKQRTGGAAGFPRHCQGKRSSTMTATEISRRTLLKTTAFGVAGATLNLGAAEPRIRRQGPHGRRRLCRRARRLRLEPGACRRHQGPQGGAGGQGRRGRERARDGRGLEVDGIDDQSRRRRPHPGDVVRLLQTLRARPRQEISRRRVPPCGAAVEQGHRSEERRLLFRLSQPGALCRRRRGGPVDQDEQARLRRGQADRQRPEQHQFVHARARDRSTRRRWCR